MRRISLALVALAALAASPAAASFTGSIYYSNFLDHHVRRLDVAGGVAGATVDLAALPGADGIILDPTDPNRLLVGGQHSNNIYAVPTSGGAGVALNTNSIVNGAFHLAVQNPVTVTGLRPGLAPALPTILAGAQEGAVPNGLGLMDMATGFVDNRLITGTLGGRVSGIEVRSPAGAVVGAGPSPAQTIYITDSPNTGLGGRLYSVNLGTNAASLITVQSNGALASHDLHSLWLDQYTGHLFSGGAKHLEEINLDALGGPQIFRSWDLTSLIPESGGTGGHIDQISSDAFGNMFAASNSGEIIYLDLTGAATASLLKTVDDVYLDDIAVGPPTIPEPATLYLAGLGLLGLALLRKRP